jgi:chlorobactene glucosyltransferase
MQWFRTPSIVAVIVFGIVTSLLFWRARKLYLAMPLLPTVPSGETPPDCMVVIPARNEEGVVGRAVKSFPPDTVIVVNDHSTDKTAEAARASGAGVLEAPPLKGSLGKANACMAGARVLTSRWILFADADTRYQEGFLGSVVQHADNSGWVFLSAHLTPRPGRLTEHLLEPYMTALFSSSARLQRDPTLLFNGQCILARREAYEFIGGHAAVSKSVAEDLKLAQLARRHRMRYGVVRAADLGHVRNYIGWQGARKRIERQALRFVHMDPKISVTILLTALCAALWLPLAVWLAFTGHLVAPGALALLVMLQLRPWYGNTWRVLLAPLAVYAAVPLLLQGLITVFVKKHIQWKGRRVKTT